MGSTDRLSRVSRAGTGDMRKVLDSRGCEILYSEEQIQARVLELAQEIEQDYQERIPYMVGILKGAAPFLNDLTKQMNVPLKTDWMAISSYGSATKSSGVVRLLKDLDENVESQHVILVEDIVDSGRTLAYLMDLFRSRKVATLKVVSFLDRPDRREVDVSIDYTGFECPDAFMVGYGMDLDQIYRNVPYIFTLKDLPDH